MTPLREIVASVLARHDFVTTDKGLTTSTSCSCGWLDGRVSVDTNGMTGARRRWELHRADTVLLELP